MKYLFFLTVVMVVFSACNKETESQSQKDEKIIIQYLADHDMEAERHESGLYHHVIVEGTGGHPDINSTIEVRYTGYLTDNYVFDATAGTSTLTIALSQMIPGWQIGIPLMKSGGTSTLFIPSALGYGSQVSADIPPNSVLIFDVELL